MMVHGDMAATPVRSCSLIRPITQLGRSKAAGESTDRAVCIFGDLVEPHWLANVTVLELGEFRFLAYRSNSYVAPATDRVEGPVSVVPMVKVIAKPIGHFAPLAGSALWVS